MYVIEVNKFVGTNYINFFANPINRTPWWPGLQDCSMQGSRVLRVKQTRAEMARIITMYSLNGSNNKSRSLIQKQNAHDRELKTRLTPGRSSDMNTNLE